MHQSRQRSPALCRRLEEIMSARARAPVYAAFPILALGLTGTFAPSRAGIPTLNQGDSIQPGEAGISAPPVETPMLNQADSAQIPDAATPSATQDHLPPLAHHPRKVTRARPQHRSPTLTRSSTTRLNQQEIIRHQVGSQAQRNSVSAFFEKLFH